MLLGLRLSKNQIANAPPWAYAMSSTTTRKVHRVLAYGDSLTAGTSGFELYPYAPHLEKTLNQRRQTAAPVVVRHRGLPGWTAANMMNDLDGPQTGLRSAIRAVKDPPLSLVIILAGSNDLGFGYTAQEITDNLVGLHQVCYQEGIPRTIAIGMPPSGYQSVNADAAALARTVDSNLESFCLNESRARYHPFPFEFEQNGQNWDPDTLHFSPRGYQVLGESLAPIVDEVLQSLDKERTM